MITIQDKEPNFRDENRLYLVYCFSCNKENYLSNVATGICAWCGWEEEKE